FHGAFQYTANTFPRLICFLVKVLRSVAQLRGLGEGRVAGGGNYQRQEGKPWIGGKQAVQKWYIPAMLQIMDFRSGNGRDVLDVKLDLPITHMPVNVVSPSISTRTLCGYMLNPNESLNYAASKRITCRGKRPLHIQHIRKAEAVNKSKSVTVLSSNHQTSTALEQEYHSMTTSEGAMNRQKLVDNFCICEGYSVPHCLMYEMYVETCGQNAQNQVNPATFGKAPSQKPASATTSRLPVMLSVTTCPRVPHCNGLQAREAHREDSNVTSIREPTAPYEPYGQIPVSHLPAFPTASCVDTTRMDGLEDQCVDGWMDMWMVKRVDGQTDRQLVHLVFPDLGTRRLGTRGNARYHYDGICIKKSSFFYARYCYLLGEKRYHRLFILAVYWTFPSRRPTEHPAGGVESPACAHVHTHKENYEQGKNWAREDELTGSRQLGDCGHRGPKDVRTSGVTSELFFLSVQPWYLQELNPPGARALSSPVRPPSQTPKQGNVLSAEEGWHPVAEFCLRKPSLTCKIRAQSTPAVLTRPDALGADALDLDLHGPPLAPETRPSSFQVPEYPKECPRKMAVTIQRLYGDVVAFEKSANYNSILQEEGAGASRSPSKTDPVGSPLSEFRRCPFWEQELAKKYSYKTMAFLADEYCNYCQDILQNVRNQELKRVEDSLTSFWKSLQQDTVMLMSLPDVCQLLKCYDRQLYKGIEDVLLHDFLEDVSIQHLESVQSFSKKFKLWLLTALEGFPALLQLSKLREVTVFVKRLRRKTYLSNMAKTMRTVLENSRRASLLKSDLRAIIRQGALDISEKALRSNPSGTDDLEENTEMKCLSSLISLLGTSTDLSVFLNCLCSNLQTSVFQHFLLSKMSQPSRSKEELIRLAASFQLRWNFLLTAVSKAMTLWHRDSFGSWHLFHLLLLEYVIHVLQSCIEEDEEGGDVGNLKEMLPDDQPLVPPDQELSRPPDPSPAQERRSPSADPPRVTLRHKSHSQCATEGSSVVVRVPGFLVDIVTGDKVQMLERQLPSCFQGDENCQVVRKPTEGIRCPNKALADFARGAENGMSLIQVLLEDKATESTIRLNLPLERETLITLKDGQKFVIHVSDVSQSSENIYFRDRVGFDESYKLIWRILFASVALLWGFPSISMGTKEKFEKSCWYAPVNIEFEERSPQAQTGDGLSQGTKATTRFMGLETVNFTCIVWAGNDPQSRWQGLFSACAIHQPAMAGSAGGLDGSANLGWTWRTSAELARPSAVPDGLVGARRSRTVSPPRTTELPCLLLPRLSSSPARARSHGRAVGLEGGNGNPQAGFHTSVASACSCPIGQSKVEMSLEKGVHVGQGWGGGRGNGGINVLHSWVFTLLSGTLPMSHVAVGTETLRQKARDMQIGERQQEKTEEPRERVQPLPAHRPELPHHLLTPNPSGDRGFGGNLHFKKWNSRTVLERRFIVRILTYTPNAINSENIYYVPGMCAKHDSTRFVMMLDPAGLGKKPKKYLCTCLRISSALLDDREQKIGLACLCVFLEARRIPGLPFGNCLPVSDGPFDNSTGVPFFYVTPKDLLVADLRKNPTASLLLPESEGEFCR
ncbi:hypothetical protein E2I00_004364, partial [Balaenoptera physalus]